MTYQNTSSRKYNAETTPLNNYSMAVDRKCSQLRQSFRSRMDSHDIVGAMHQSLQVFHIAKHSLRHSLHCLTLQLSHRHSIVRVYRSSIGRIVPLPHRGHFVDYLPIVHLLTSSLVVHRHLSRSLPPLLCFT